MAKTFSKVLLTTFQAQLQDSEISDSDRQLVMRLLHEASTSVLASKAAPSTKKRARSNYQLWKSDEEVKTLFRAEHPGLNGADTNIEMGKIWKAMTDEEKSPWTERSSEEKAEFGASSEEEAPKPKSGTRKRARTPYQCYKKDKTVIQAQRAEHPDLDQKAFNAHLKEQFSCLSVEEKAPYEAQASQDKDLVDQHNHVPVASAPTSDTEAVAPTSDPEAVAPTSDPEAVAPTSDPEAVAPTSDPEAVVPSVPPAETPQVVQTQPKRKPSPYQKWKKDPATKEQFLESHPGTDKASIHSIMKATWDAMSDEARAPWN